MEFIIAEEEVEVLDKLEIEDECDPEPEVDINKFPLPVVIEVEVVVDGDVTAFPVNLLAE